MAVSLPQEPHGEGPAVEDLAGSSSLAGAGDPGTLRPHPRQACAGLPSRVSKVYFSPQACQSLFFTPRVSTVYLSHLLAVDHSCVWFTRPSQDKEGHNN